MLPQEQDKRRQERIVIENDLTELINRDLQMKRQQQDLRALSRNIVNNVHISIDKGLYSYVGGAFWKTPVKNYYKTVEKALGDVTVQRKQLRKEIDALLLELIKKTAKEEYSLLSTLVAEELSEYQQRIQDEMELAD